jgi:uncharacterized phosphosugar-binding protein
VGYKLVSKIKNKANEQTIPHKFKDSAAHSHVCQWFCTGHSYLSTNIISYEAPTPENIGGEVVL